ncbi:hypothetical protein ACGFIW_04260 [Micromonospora sp. NPDC048935]|uniref:hypothetical protein n=1 Tax=Micromonospora sp. NPDC048935 TaxID=3364262 RepID=UPI00371A88F4
MPRLLAVIPAGMVALTLVAYGVLSAAVVVDRLVTGELRWSEVWDGWAVTATLLVFLSWGVALGVTTAGYALTARPTTTRTPWWGNLRR